MSIITLHVWLTSRLAWHSGDVWGNCSSYWEDYTIARPIQVQCLIHNKESYPSWPEVRICDVGRTKYTFGYSSNKIWITKGYDFAKSTKMEHSTKMMTGHTWDSRIINLLLKIIIMSFIKYVLCYIFVRKNLPKWIRLKRHFKLCSIQIESYNINTMLGIIKITLWD
jgi:hypothetical protein